MDFLESNKIILFIIFIIPGFISIKAYQLFFPSSLKDAKDIVIDAVAYSCVNYTLLGVPIYYVQRHLISSFSLFDIYLYILSVLFIFPIVWVVIWKKIRESNWGKTNAPHPIMKPWDYVFSQRKRLYIKVVLKNGDIVGGLYDGKSFASSDPAPEHIYIEKAWIFKKENGVFEREINDSEGILIMPGEISHMFFKTVKDRA
ncbi:DUF6338 family protein [Yersinia rochesterensis]|uniref:DUF6338 family protein n=1 Tax=Yersinia rochesterensis TaxID=1604335 RepID=UPI0011A79ED2|nr:DUF6338 family protein [Yersinia rochesterensis]